MNDSPRRLRADFREHPIDIDSPPMLSWEPSRRHDTVELEFGPVGGPTTLEKRRTPAPRWELAGPMASTTAFRWRVRIACDDRPDEWSGWSAWSTFETALLHERDWSGAQWIGAGVSGPSPVLSAEVDGIRSDRLRLAVCGLGTVDVRINGAAVTDAVLDPPPSAYDSVVHYRVYDVSALVRPGINSVTARLGRGFYAMMTPTTFGWHSAPWHDEPKLRLVLFDLGYPEHPLLVSHDGWTSAPTAVTDDSFYTGEVVDFRRVATIERAAAAAPPTGELRVSRQPPVTRRGPVDIAGPVRTGPRRQRFDLSVNVAGMVTVSTEDQESPTLHVKLGEHLGADGEVLAADPAVHGELQRSTLIGVPAGTAVPLELSYGGMRHVEVSGTAAPVSARVDRISAAPDSVGTFDCSDELLNSIHRITRLTLENCLQGTPVDTPLYEKQAYTGDAQLLTETYAYNYWMPNYLGGWYESSVLPSQNADGSMPGIAPGPPGDWIFDTPSPAWDAALFEVPETLARHYGDLATMRRALPALRRYLAYLAERFPDGVIDVGLGDWNAPGHIMPPEPPAIVSTAYHHRFLVLMSAFLVRLGEHAEAREYASRAQALRGRFQARFWREGGWFAGGSGGAGDGGGFRQTDNLLAVTFGLATRQQRAAVLASLEQNLLARDCHLDTGMIGTRQLLRVLARHRPGLAFDVVHAAGYPGWSYWLENGATTLYENWELDGRSHNHAMFGTIDEWLFADVAGIAPGADGWSAVSIDPRVPGDGTFSCRASLDTISGEIEVEWEDRRATIRGRVIAPSELPVAVPPGSDCVEVARGSARLGRRTEHVLELRPIRPAQA
jgi:alpha-L-rhamnosidase